MLPCVAFGNAAAISERDLLVWGGQISNFSCSPFVFLIETVVSVPSLASLCVGALAKMDVDLSGFEDIARLVEDRRRQELEDAQHSADEIEKQRSMLAKKETLLMRLMMLAAMEEQQGDDGDDNDGDSEDAEYMVDEDDHEDDHENGLHSD